MNIYFYTLSIVISSSPTYAYWDPGTGSAILQAILALAGSILVYLGIFKQKIKNFIERIIRFFKKNINKNDNK